ncbi:MAG: hypothetical protein U5R06_20605 [candidate division KSB1 bacterium]|nr:hypothetical protein [candidate division KSB1 bacterium]
MRTSISLLVFLLFFVLANFSFAGISHVKTYPGYRLNDSIGKANDAESVEKAVSNYLKSHEKEFGIKSKELQLKSSYFSCGNYYLIYEQYHSEIPVHTSKVGIKVATDGTIKKVGVHFYLNFPSSFPYTITNDNAMNIAKNLFKDHLDESVKVESSSMIIVPDDKENCYTLCWKVELSNLEAGKGEAFYIDANKGSLVHKEETIRKSINGTVEGSIWL